MSSNLKLYLVSLQEGVSCGYDRYDSFVVVAESAEAAIKMHPAEMHMPGREKEATDYWGWEWERDTSYLDVKYIGEADIELASGKVICSSYNAG